MKKYVIFSYSKESIIGIITEIAVVALTVLAGLIISAIALW